MYIKSYISPLSLSYQFSNHHQLLDFHSPPRICLPSSFAYATMPDHFLYWSADSVPDPSRNAAAPAHPYKRGSDVFNFNDASPIAPTLPNVGPNPRSPSHMMPSYGFDAWGNPSQPSGPGSMHHAAIFPSQANGSYVDADLDTLAPPLNDSSQLLPMSFEQELQAYTYPGASVSAQDGYFPAVPARDAVHAGHVTQAQNRPILEQEYDEKRFPVSPPPANLCSRT